MLVGGACALSLFAASYAAALAYYPDSLPLPARADIALADPALPGTTEPAVAVAIDRGNTATADSPANRLLSVGSTASASLGGGSGATTIGSFLQARRQPALAVSGSPLPAGLTAARVAVPVAPAPSLLQAAPGLSQFDGSIWASSNCGPTALAMALGALGIRADQLTLRQLANARMGQSDPSAGTTWESLAAVARHFGAKTSALYQNGQNRTWTVAEVKQELSAGHPVLLLTHYRDLPTHLTSAYLGDHYIVALGTDSQGNLLYNDPASAPGDSFTHAISIEQLQRAWTDTNDGIVRTAMALST